MKTVYYFKNKIYKILTVLTVIFTLFFGQAIFSVIGEYISQNLLNNIVSYTAPIFANKEINFSVSNILFGFDIKNPVSVIENETVVAENTNIKVVTKTIETPKVASYDTSVGVKVKNSTDYDIDVDSLINEDLKFTINKNEPSVLIIHTHTSESYLPVANDDFEQSDPHRTQNPKYNVVRVGEEFKKALEEQGFSVIHDTTVHDYPSYNGSYLNAQKTIEKNLQQYPSIKIVLDIHRDAVESEGNVYKFATTIDGKKTAQIMIVAGSDANGIENPNWRENLKFALKYQRRLNLLYPTLARDIDLRRERFNTNLTLGSIILEVGTTGNTLDEAVNAARLSGKALGDMLKYITK